MATFRPFQFIYGAIDLDELITDLGQDETNIIKRMNEYSWKDGQFLLKMDFRESLQVLKY